MFKEKTYIHIKFCLFYKRGIGIGIGIGPKGIGIGIGIGIEKKELTPTLFSIHNKISDSLKSKLNSVNPCHHLLSASQK